MKRTRIFSGVLGMVVLIAVLCTGVIGASASGGVTVTTSTVYDMNDPSMVKVTSKISNVEEDDQITYLAYDAPDNEEPYADETGTNIRFVDQLESVLDDEEEVYVRTFTFTAKAKDITSTVVRFGAQKTAVPNEAKDTNPDILAHNVNIAPVEGGTVQISVRAEGEDNWVTPDPTTPIIEGDVRVTIDPDNGKAIGDVKIKIGGTSWEGNYVINDDWGTEFVLEDINGELSINVTFIDRAPAEEGGEAQISNGRNFTAENGTDLSGTEKTAVAFSRVSVPANTKRYEYGVLLYFNEEYSVESFDLSTVTVTEPDENTTVARVDGIIYKFRAIAASADGQFAVKLIDGREGAENALADGPFYLRPYLIYGDSDTVLLGRAVEYNIQ